MECNLHRSYREKIVDERKWQLLLDGRFSKLLKRGNKQRNIKQWSSSHKRKNRKRKNKLCRSGLRGR